MQETRPDPLLSSVAAQAFTIPAGQAPLYVGSFNVHVDHLDTPRLVSNLANQSRWTWLSEPFGMLPANENPAGLGVFPFSPRFPGQVIDKETNTHYNYFRDYDPGIGRYIQSDPIGLAGGINTYAYVRGNPLSTSDSSGLGFEQLLNPLVWGPPLIIGGIWAANNPQAAQALWNAINNSSSGSSPLGSGNVPPSGGAGDYCIQNPNDPICQPGASPSQGQHCTIPQSRAAHIFRQAEGHIPDTPANRQLLTNVGSNPRNLLGTDNFGNQWYAQSQSNGTQVWVQVRNGQVTNGGVNLTPRTFNPQMGLVKP